MNTYNEIYNAAFEDELQKIAENKMTKTKAGVSHFKTVASRSAGYGLLGAAAGAGLGALTRKPVGIMTGANIGGFAGALKGHAVGAQKFIKKHTGKTVSQPKAFGKSYVQTGLKPLAYGLGGGAAGAGVGAGAGSLIAKALRKSGKAGATIGAISGGLAGYYGGTIRGYGAGAKKMIESK